MFAPTFSIWTTIEECLNPPVIWEKGRGWFTTEPFSEPEMFVFPDGIGPVECVNVEHEEVLLVPRWIDCNRVTFKYGLGDETIDVLRTLHKLGLDGTAPVRVRGGEVSPRDVVAACLPDPATLGDRMTGKTCAGTWVTGTGTDGAPREVYLYHVVDTEETWARDGAQAVVWQTAINPVIALELIANGTWSGAGVLGPEAFDAGAVPRPVERLRVAVGHGGTNALHLAVGRLEQLDGIAGRVLDHDLSPAGARTRCRCGTGRPRDGAASTSASMSSTVTTNRFHPPGAGCAPSGIGRAAELAGPLTHRWSSPAREQAERRAPVLRLREPEVHQVEVGCGVHVVDQVSDLDRHGQEDREPLSSGAIPRSAHGRSADGRGSGARGRRPMLVAVLTGEVRQACHLRSKRSRAPTMRRSPGWLA